VHGILLPAKRAESQQSSPRNPECAAQSGLRQVECASSLSVKKTMRQAFDCTCEGNKLASKLLCNRGPCGGLRPGMIVCYCKLLNLNGRYQLCGLHLGV
jgi:hypothetical protein